MGELSFRFSILSFVRRGQREVAALQCHGRADFPLAITMRTDSKLYPASILPLQRGGREGLLSHRQSEGRFDIR
jgi:hypothetical protein